MKAVQQRAVAKKVKASPRKRTAFSAMRDRLYARVQRLDEDGVSALLRLTKELEKREPSEPLAFVLVPSGRTRAKTAAARFHSITEKRPVGTIPAGERELLSEILGSTRLVELTQENEGRVLAHRRSLLEGALSTDQVREALQLGTRQAVASRVKRKELLAIRHGRELRFPTWQFEDSQPSGVVPGLSNVLRAASQLSDIEVASWLLRPQRAFEDSAPIDVLRTGEIDRVVKAVRGVGVT